MSGDPATVMIGGHEFVRSDDEWMLWCDCGDLIPLDEVIHDHCGNCHALCPSTPEEVNEAET